MLARLLLLLILVVLLIGLTVGSVALLVFGWWIGFAVLLGVFVAIGLHALLVAAEFALSRRGIAPAAACDRLGIAEALGVYWREVRHAFMTFVVRLPFLGDRPLASAPAPGREGVMPIVLIHGYFCNRALWRPFARWLAQRGHVVGSVNLEPVFGSIDDFAPIIEREVKRIRALTGHEQVGLVCHSMGGLAARAYLRRFGDGAIETVVTLGTPHRGTSLAAFGHGANVRQMRRDSQWLAELGAAERRRSGEMFTVILSTHDNIVSPQTIQTIPGAHTIELTRLGHLTLALEPMVWTIVGEILTNPWRSRPANHPNG